MEDKLTRYNILIKDKNVKIKLDDSPQKVNFYNRRYIKAQNKTEAEQLRRQSAYKRCNPWKRN